MESPLCHEMWNFQLTNEQISSPQCIETAYQVRNLCLVGNAKKMYRYWSVMPRKCIYTVSLLCYFIVDYFNCGNIYTLIFWYILSISHVDISPYGGVRRLRTDNGREYTSKECFNIMLKNTIKHEFFVTNSKKMYIYCTVALLLMQRKCMDIVSSFC